MKKQTIAIVAGGYSSESVVASKSANGIYSFIDKEKYTPYIVIIEKIDWYVEINNTKLPIDRNDFSFTKNGEKIKFDYAYITIHGTPGEDGTLQGYFDMISIPYSCCGVLAASLTFNKYCCNRYLSALGFKVAPSIRLLAGEQISNETVISEISLPCFIKPNVGGSSFGTTKVKTAAEIQPAIAAAFAEGGEVIIEQFMQGIEVTCGCFKTKKGIQILPITEVVSKNEFFDYEAKYTASKVEEITPARISPTLTKEIQEQTIAIYKHIDCKGIIRVDMIIINNVPHILEINTTPGMTPTSFIPQQIKAASLNIQDVLTEIISTEI